MNLGFWDGVLISSMFWAIISVVCLIRGLFVGGTDDVANWSKGFDDGWNSAFKFILDEILQEDEQ